MDLGLRGKRAIVTGGTRGIGRAIALQLAEEGCDVAICARNAAQVADTVAAIEAKGVKGWGGTADATDHKSFVRWIEDAAKALGGLDVFVANVSAISSPRTEESWRLSFEVDMLSTAESLETAARLMAGTKDGSIVFIGTTGAIEMSAAPRPYTAVKAGMINYVKGMAKELTPKGIRVNTVSPGTIYFDGGVWDSRRQKMPELYNAMMKANPMGRMGRPEEVADMVVFLSSPRASFVSGTNTVVDGGLTQRV